jgi:glutamyl/glutaminyl-tRNA synthetase
MTTAEPIRARFAPSPTGYLHVGGARTALFNWLFCRRFGGTFILRIEDTDILRNIEGAEAKLIEDLRWLGIDYDEGPDVGGPAGPYRQSERRDLYDTAAKKLLAEGKAYYAFDTPEELDALRREAVAKKVGFRYPRPANFPTEADATRARAEGRPVVARFAVPDEAITIHDEILGDVTFAAGELEDLVIVKSNGWPTYHFAVVVDDAHMKISHVLRAQEHLMNTPKHVFMQRALGYATPAFAHLPLVFNLDNSKMSKRDKAKAVQKAIADCGAKMSPQSPEGAAWHESLQSAAGGSDVIERLKKGDAPDSATLDRLARFLGVQLPEIDVHDFRVSGYLPEALVNFVALIGWSPGNDREILTRQEMIDAFSTERINKTAGRFDREKLLSFNTTYVAAATPERLRAAFRDWAAAGDSPMARLDDATVDRVLAACKGFRTFADVEAKAGVLFIDDAAVPYDADAVRKVLAKNGGAGYAMLERVLPELAALADWSADAIEAWVKTYCERTGSKMGDVAQPLRVAVAGRPVSPSIGETLSLLGRDRTLVRIRRCMDKR